MTIAGAHYDVAVIGAGVIGLATARAFLQAGKSVVVVEAEPGLAAHTSGRGSGVIHAGIYYKAASLKAKLCVRGRELLYDYCKQHNVPNYKVGKFIVAPTQADEGTLRGLYHRGVHNGVAQLKLISTPMARTLEPNLDTACDTVLWSPATGVVSAGAYLQCLAQEVMNTGGAIRFSNEVRNVEPVGSEFDLTLMETPNGTGFDVISRVTVSVVVNAAGLSAGTVADRIEGLPEEHHHLCQLVQGQYYRYNAPSPFSRLVYPLPVDGGLGIHATNDLYGNTVFGPDATRVSAINYTPPPRTPSQEFVESIRSYYPKLDVSKLSPGWTAVRPHLEQDDFRIDGPSVHGMSGLVNLFGIESPGLTTSLAIAEEVVQLEGLG